ncbi:MAG: diaminopimelate decarboxylase [Bacteroidia bacterium]
MTLNDQHQYTMQGLDVNALCEEFGTPLYLYNADTMLRRYHELADAFAPMNGKVKYAAKALTNPHILRLLKEAGAGLDTVSLQEVHIGLMAGFKASDIIFTPNCVSFEEIKAAVKLGVVINIDNISILEQFGHEFENSVPVCIRFNPHITAGGNANIQVGHIDSKFGISVYQRRHVQRLIKASNIQVKGLHVHTGSDILDPSSYVQVAEIMFDIAREFDDLDFLDFGSGFKVPYKPGGNSTDVAEIGKQLIPTYEAFCEEYGKKLEIWLEPGKYIVSESGFFLTRANVIKPTPATVFVGVDSGLNHLIRPMLYHAHHEIFNLSNPNGTPRIYTIVGYICETDTFGSDRKLAEVREGDIIGMANAGAYCYSMASNYNSRLRPAEVLVHEGKASLIRRRETMDDLLGTVVNFDK